MFDNDVYLDELALGFSYLEHVGKAHDADPPGRGSGRYGWGTGDRAFQHEAWYGWYKEREKLQNELKAQGLKGVELDKAIGERMNMSTSEYRRMVSITKEQKEAAVVSYAKNAMDGGMSRNAVAKELGMSESTLRGMMARSEQYDSQKISKTAEMLKECVEKSPYLIVGSGTGAFMTGQSGYTVSDETIKAAIKMMGDGYITTEVKVPQLGNRNGELTTVKLLVPNPNGLSEKEIKNDIYQNHLGDITPVSAHFEEINGEVRQYKWEYPTSIDSKRLQVVYAEDGGTDRDGVIELRRGCKDLDLGDGVRYAQVRIGVDDTHYLKGMAVYSDDLPPGCDVRFNTNKKSDVPVLGEDNNHSVLKLMKTDDPNNPFGSALRQNDAQYHYEDDDGTIKLSPINKCRQEGDWDMQRLSLPAQFLSKQSTQLAQTQLQTNYENLEAEYSSIMALTNPVIRKSQLMEFAEKCDAQSIELRGAALPGQKTKVLLPSPSLKEGECYLPDFEDGARVCLVRYPHQNIAEIPVLINNTKNKEAKNMIGDGVDAIAVHPSAAAQLSGADYDGDTCTVIRDEERKIITASPIKELVDFEPKRDYPHVDGTPDVGPKKEGGDGFNYQKQMGMATNLLTDMQQHSISFDHPDVIAATKWAMLVIDAEKHNLNHKQAYKDLGIAKIRKEWDMNGASTLISRATSPERVTKRKMWNAAKNSIDPVTGEKIYKEADDAHYTTSSGVEKTMTQGSYKGKEWTIEQLYSSNGPTVMEKIYGDFMQKCRDLGNKSRLSWLNTPNQEYSPSAAKAYANEVASLNEKLRKAEANAPREKQAQALANADLAALKKENPALESDKDLLKKTKNTLLENARLTTGAHKDRIVPTEKEWEAIQAGAITNNKLERILSNSNKDAITQLARPRDTRKITTAQETRIKNLRANGYSIAEIADFVGVSSSTVSNVINPSKPSDSSVA